MGIRRGSSIVSAGIIKNELEELSKDQYQIWAGGKNSANQDIATLFFCRAMDLYLRPGGQIGMVLPHSALRSGQHAKWRGGYYEAKRRSRSRERRRAISANFGTRYPWDLGELEPRDFFPMVSCVVFASFAGGWGDVESHKRAAKPLAPGRVEVWKGAPGSPDVERVVSTLISDDGKYLSPYEKQARRGADIFDRRLFLVTTSPNDSQFALSNTRKTYPSIGSQDKKDYSVRALEGYVVTNDNIFNLHLGETVAPYVTLAPRTAVLPVSRDSMSMPLDHSECKTNGSGQHKGRRKCVLDVQALHPNMRSRWEIMQNLWDANKGKRDARSLFDNLNYLNKLTSQLEYLHSAGSRACRIAYTGHGRPTAALITDNRVIVDYTLFQVTCSGPDEAYFLLATINSLTLEDAVVPLMSKGQYGARHLQKQLWKLPIPKYDAGIEVHSKLSELGRAAEHSATERISNLRERTGEDSLTITKARNELRHRWQKASPECRAIEELVEELLLTD